MVARRGYVPARGDAVWIDLNPQAGHVRAGRRPAVVLSPVLYNKRAGLALFCPVTSHVREYPFETLIPPGLEISGAVLCDQVKCLDWKIRSATFICRLPPALVDDVLRRLNTLLQE